MSGKRRGGRRRHPYIWPTWISKLLAGEERCWWKSWYKALHFYEKKVDPDRESFLAGWTKTHDAMVEKRAARMKSDGWLVRVEDEGEFTLEGKSATLAGKPDIVGIRDGQALVIDAKAGKKRKSDHWQVLIYLFALPLAWLKGHSSLHGEVQYQDEAVAVRRLGDAEVQAITEAIRRVSDPTEEPPTVPSARECERCDVAACPDRFEKRPAGDARSYF